MKKLLLLLVLASCTVDKNSTESLSEKKEIDNRVLQAHGQTTLYSDTHSYIVDGKQVEKTYWRDSAFNLLSKADAFYSDTDLVVLSFFDKDTLVKVIGTTRTKEKGMVGKATYYLNAEGKPVYKEEMNYRLRNLDSVVHYQNRERANFTALHKRHD